jgi:hypothetical protein
MEQTGGRAWLVQRAAGPVRRLGRRSADEYNSRALGLSFLHAPTARENAFVVTICALLAFAQCFGMLLVLHPVILRLAVWLI